MHGQFYRLSGDSLCSRVELHCIRAWDPGKNSEKAAVEAGKESYEVGGKASNGGCFKNQS